MATYAFEPEHRKFLQLLYKHKVDYMLVGGVVVNLYGYTRGTGDLDILFNPSVQNKQRLMRAIEAFGYDTTEFNKKKANEITMFTLGERTYQGHIELTNRIAGITYEEASLRKQRTLVDKITISYLHLDDLLKNKQAAGRQKDLVDVEKLQQIKQRQSREELRLSEEETPIKLSVWQRIGQILFSKKNC